MKIPQRIFKVINIIVIALLRSPLHFLLSDKVMVLNFRGRKSGKRYSTPVSYLFEDGTVYFITARQGTWWRNLRDGAEFSLLIKGVERSYDAELLDIDSPKLKSKLLNFLQHLPQNAAYHDIRINPDKSFNEADVERALPNAIVFAAVRKSL